MDALKKKRLLDSFGSGPDLLESALKSIGTSLLDWTPDPKEWTVRQIIFHVTDSEANYYIRFRQAVAQSGGMVVGFDQNKWTESLAYPGRSIDEALQLFHWLRISSFKLLSQLPDAAWANTVQHSERGTLTLETLLTIAENHVTEHLQQIETNVKRYGNR